jgi:1,2-diacylglycerol 3-alpha-glucosyltransferase
VPGPVVVAFDRLGPYHAARISAAAARYPTVALEFGSESTDYAWDRIETGRQFARHTVIEAGDAQSAPFVEFARTLHSTLERIEPSVVAVPGWMHVGALLTLRWALAHGVPAIMMSASTQRDAARTRLRESLKARVVQLCAAALVGGKPHREYMQVLGMTAHNIFPGYDVVDNEYFATRAREVRESDSSERARRKLPKRFLLASSRFIEKKNLPVLLQAYAQFRASAGVAAPKLVLLGDGPLKAELLALRASLGLGDDVIMPGFVQYEELPAYYGLAEAFVHASTVEQWGLVANEAMAAGLPVILSATCGCAEDLVEEGQNGFTFDPRQPAQLADALAKIAENEETRARMAIRSREIIARYSPVTFADSLARARDVALAAPRARLSLVDHTLLTALALYPKASDQLHHAWRRATAQ